jgi:hypothetical protein
MAVTVQALTFNADTRKVQEETLVLSLVRPEQ